MIACVYSGRSAYVTRIGQGRTDKGRLVAPNGKVPQQVRNMLPIVTELLKYYPCRSQGLPDFMKDQWDPTGRNFEDNSGCSEAFAELGPVLTWTNVCLFRSYCLRHMKAFRFVVCTEGLRVDEGIVEVRRVILGPRNAAHVVIYR